jgi:hypothetical protein
VDGDLWADTNYDPPLVKTYDATNTEWTGVGGTIIPLTNKSGGALAANDVVTADPDNDSAVDTSTTLGDPKVLGVARATIANDAAGDVLLFGVTSVKTTGTVNRGEYLKHSTSAKTAIATTDPGDKGVSGL